VTGASAALKVLVVDNYDSFTYNLVQLLGELGAGTEVVRNDAIGVPELVRRVAEGTGPDGILISPGPCTPKEAGISVATIEVFAGKIPILGVCLGPQSIGAAWGGRRVRAHRIMHGKTSPILHDGRGVFEGLSNPFEATRYHSLVIERESIPATLAVSAWTADGEIMGVRHKGLAEDQMLEGVQFHPESIKTEEGRGLMSNWLRRVGRHAKR
jgi:anthranilate synthase/aminodeoxychorismate synthase-like glutamine amidotransferase